MYFQLYPGNCLTLTIPASHARKDDMRGAEAGGQQGAGAGDDVAQAAEVADHEEDKEGPTFGDNAPSGGASEDEEADAEAAVESAVEDAACLPSR